MKRATYKASLAEALEEGLSPIYIDESGFRSETARCHEYAPRGVRVPDMRSSFQQYRHTSMIAARSAEGFTASALFLRAAVMPTVSMSGFSRRYVHS